MVFFKRVASLSFFLYPLLLLLFAACFFIRDIIMTSSEESVYLPTKAVRRVGQKKKRRRVSTPRAKVAMKVEVLRRK